MRRGEVWQVGTDALFAVGDLEDGDAMRLLSFAKGRGLAPTAIYSDPPWTQAVASQFRKKAGASGSPNLFTLFRALATVCADVGGPCFLEIGKDSLGDLQNTLFAESRRFSVRVVKMGYGSRNAPSPSFGLALSALRGFFQSELDYLAERMEGCHSIDGPRTFLDAVDPSATVVADFCTGLGATPKAAAKAGAGFVGMEIDPKRLDVSLGVYEKITGEKRSIIGYLGYLEGFDV